MRPVLQNKTHACCYKPAIKPEAGEVRSPRGEPIIVILLNGHVVILLSKQMSIPMDLCFSQFWSEELPFAVGSSLCRDSYLVKVPNHDCLAADESSTLTSKTWETPRKRVRTNARTGVLHSLVF